MDSEQDQPNNQKTEISDRPTVAKFSDNNPPQPANPKKGIHLSKKQAALVVVILILVLAAAVAAFFYYSPTNSNLESPLAGRETKEKEPEADEETEKASKNQYKSDVLAISFDRPDNWQINEDSKGLTITSADYKKDSKSEFDGVNPLSGAIITINSYENAEDQTLKEVVENDPGALDFSKNKPGDPNSYPLKKGIKTLRVDGLEARQYLWAYEGAYIHTVLLSKDNKIFAINLDAATGQTQKNETLDSFTDYRDEYDQIIGSLKFL